MKSMPWKQSLTVYLLIFLSFIPNKGTGYEISYKQAKLIVDGVAETDWDKLRSMLNDQLTLNGDNPAGEPLADDLAFFTRQYLIQEGWPNAAVNWKLEQGAMHLQVEPGQRVLVGEPTFKGETIVPAEELRQFFLKPTLEQEGMDHKAPHWVERNLLQGVDLVQRRLRAEGYLNAKVLFTPDAEPGADMKRGMTLEVIPGPKYVFGQVTITGAPTALNKETQAELIQAEGTPFNEARVQQIEQRLRSICVKHGWLNAATAAKYALSPTGGAVNVLLEITPGQRVRIAQVSIHPDFSGGAQRVLRARFKPLEGRIYESEESDFYFKRALDTGMFALLDTEIQPVAGDATSGVLRVTGEETQPHTLGFELGFDTFLGGQAGVTYKNTNWHNTGNTLAAELSYSVAGPVGFVSYTNPAVFNSSHAATVRLALEQFNRFEYDRLGTALNLDITRRVSLPFSYGYFIGTSANTVSTKILTPDQVGPTNYTLASLGANFMYDRRDSPVIPRKGWYISGRLESTLDVMGSNVSFIRTDLRGAWYQPISKKWRFATGAELSTIQGSAAEKLPIDARVFNGGPNSVRSFAQRELGPVTPGGTPLGGTSALFASAEFSYEVISNLELAFFTDAGSLGRGNNSSAFDFSTDFRYAIGAGIRYKLPFGPIRIDYGHNPNRREGEKSGMLHVTVGFAF